MSASASASTPSKMHGNAQPQQVPHLVGDLELCILTSCVGLYSEPPVDITEDRHVLHAQSTMMTTDSDVTYPSPDDISSTFTCLLFGPLAEFLVYSREENSRWLIDISHDICDPRFKRGSLQVWDVTGQVWRNVDPTDPLIASSYLYKVQDVVSLSKISARAGKSKTAATGNPATMARRVKDRDGNKCWLTRCEFPIVNSHICPKRMGDHLLRVVYNTFVAAPPPPTLSIYDELCGVTLNPAINALFDMYQCGLRLVGQVRNPSHLVFYS